MTPLDIMKQPAAYANGYEKMPSEAQNHAKQLCWEYNHTAPNEQEKRHSILQELLGTCPPMAGIEPDFHCDYGFNIHMHGFAFLNYNCVILDTSPVNIGAGAFIAPGVCLMPSIRNSAVRVSGRQPLLRLKKMYGLVRMLLSAAV